MCADMSHEFCGSLMSPDHCCSLPHEVALPTAACHMPRPVLVHKVSLDAAFSCGFSPGHVAGRQRRAAASRHETSSPRPPRTRGSYQGAMTGATPDWPRSQDDYFHLCPRPGSAGEHRDSARWVEPVQSGRSLLVGSTGRLVCFSDAKATWLGHLSARGSCGRGRRLRLDNNEHEHHHECAR